MDKKTEVVEVLKDYALKNANKGLYMQSLKPLKDSQFTISPDGTGFQVKQLGNTVLEFMHFQKIIEKANELGGKMLRGDELAQVKGFRLGKGISHDCMEGFIAHELLHIEDGSAITRRSTYYSGILAAAGIVTIYKSAGEGSYVIVNAKYCNI